MRDLDRNLRAYAEYIDVLPVTASEAMRIKPARTRLQPVLAAAVAAVIVVIVVGGVAWLAGRDDRPVVDTRPTLPPTTITSTTTTTTTEPTTTTEAAALVPPITWARIDSPVLTGGGGEWATSMSVVNGVIYVVGADWPDEADPDAIILRSEDGITWERFDDPSVFGGPGSQNIFGVAYRDGVTVAVGLDCTEDESACPAAVWTSEDDGHTWVRLPHQEAFPMGPWERMLAVTATESGFVAVGDEVWTSPNGRDWTMTQELPDFHMMWDVVATPDLIVGVGQRWDNGSEAAIWISQDGTEWTRVSDEAGDFDAGEGKVSWLSGVTTTDRGFVAVGMAGIGAEAPILDLDAVAWRSADGHTWRRVAPALSSESRSEEAEAVTQVDGWVLAVGRLYDPDQGPGFEGPGFVWASSDGGLSWTQLPNTDRIFGWWTDGYTGMFSVAEFDGQVVVAGTAPHVGVAVWIGTIESS